MRSKDRTLLLVLFSLSGFSGLVYESIWTHYLKLFLGHAAGAQALVLALFMGGMAIGAALASRRSARLRDPLLAYAVVEALVGVLALAFHEAFVAATGLAFDVVLPRLAGQPAAVQAVKWGLSALLVLPQCVLLGATFPLMAAGVLRRDPERQGRGIALLYFANSLGGVAGALLAGLWLLAAAGLPGTVRVAAVVNLAVAAAVWTRVRRAGAPDPAGEIQVTPLSPWQSQGERGPPAGPGVRFLLGVSLVTGASSFVYEIAWTRMLSLVLGASTRAFELMLASFILGLALGGLWIRGRIDALRSPARALVAVQIAMGLLALATLPVYGQAFDVMRWVMNALPRSDGGYRLFSVSCAGIAMAVMLPAAICAGMTLPLVTIAVLRRGAGEAGIGAVYAANTVGAIVAVAFAAPIGMPLLGVKGLLVLGAALDLALGVALAWRARAELARRGTSAALAACSAAAVAVAVLLLPVDPVKAASGVYRLGKLLDPTDEVVFHRDGRTATVSLVATPSESKLRIATNGKVDAAITTAPARPPQLDEYTMVLLGALPMSLHPGARTAACIGFGAGITTTTLLGNPNLTRVDTVEIEEQMVAAARGFAPHNDLAYSDPRSRIHVEDAKTFFSTSGTRYDVVVSEPSNPWVSGVGGLFSDEFYGRVRASLEDGGLFVQWLQLYEIYPGLVASVLKGIERNFEDYAVYAPCDGDAIIVARKGGDVGAPDPAIFGFPRVARTLRRLSIEGVQDLDVRRIGDRRSWRGLTATFRVPVNSDYDPVLDQNAERARFLQRSSDVLATFARAPFPVVDMLSPAAARGDRTEITRTPHFAGSERAREAMLLRDLFLRREAPAAEQREDVEVFRQAMPFALWLRRCEREDAGPLPLDALRFVAWTAAPALTPGELRELWKPLRACDARLGPSDRGWVEYVTAIGDRDAAALARTARSLLEAEGLPTEDVHELLAGALLGSIANGDVAGARTLWSRYAHALDVRNDLLLRMLVARATVGDAITQR